MQGLDWIYVWLDWMGNHLLDYFVTPKCIQELTLNSWNKTVLSKQIKGKEKLDCPRSSYFPLSDKHLNQIRLRSVFINNP